MKDMKESLTDRYARLFSELELIEYQLKHSCRIEHGREIAGRIISNTKKFTSPKTFEDLLGGKDGK